MGNKSDKKRYVVAIGRYEFLIVLVLQVVAEPKDKKTRYLVAIFKSLDFRIQF